MLLVDREELATSIGTNVKTVDRLNGKVFFPTNGGSPRPLFDLHASMEAYAKHCNRKKRDQLARQVGEASDELMISVLRRWRSKVRLAQQKLNQHKEDYLPFSELAGLWLTMRLMAIDLINALPGKVADRISEATDIPTVSQILRDEIHDLLNEIKEKSDLACDRHLEAMRDEEEESEQAQASGDVVELINAERSRHNNLISELNERAAAIVSGELVSAVNMEAAMSNRVGMARTRLLAISGMCARIPAAQERATIITELKIAMADVVSELRVITSDQVADLSEIQELSERLEEEAEDIALDAIRPVHEPKV